MYFPLVHPLGLVSNYNDVWTIKYKCMKFTVTDVQNISEVNSLYMDSRELFSCFGRVFL